MELEKADYVMVSEYGCSGCKVEWACDYVHNNDLPLHDCLRMGFWRMLSVTDYKYLLALTMQNS